MTTPNQKKRTGGEGITNAGFALLKYGLPFMTGSIIVIVTVGLMAMDLVLGPLFQNDLANSSNTALGIWGGTTPWVFSFATTGLLYAMLQPGVNKSTKIYKFIGPLALAIGICDSLTDWGGFNAWLFRSNPAAGADIFPPAGASAAEWALGIFVGFMCFAHEALLGVVLAIFQEKANKKNAPMGGIGLGASKPAEADGGDKLEASLIYFAGIVYNLVKTFCILIGAFSLIILDVILAPQAWDDNTTKFAILIASGMFAGVQILIWVWYARVGRAGGVKKLEPTQKYIMLGAVILTIVDTALDITGFNNAIYGENSLIISQPSLSWLVLVFMVSCMVTLNEPFIRDIFRNLKASSKNALGGGINFGGGGGFTFPSS